MSNFNNPVDIAWRAYLAVLKQEGLSREEMSIAQQSYKDGWHECERQTREALLLPCPVCGGEAIHAIDTLKRTVIQSSPPKPERDIDSERLDASGSYWPDGRRPPDAIG